MNYTLITGVSSGIGYEFAHLFAKKGHHLILVSRNSNTLNEISEYLEDSFKVKVYSLSIDLSNTDAAQNIYNFINQKSITVKYLINNAGFYVKGSFSETNIKEEQNLIQLQCITHTQLTKLLLPKMIESQSGGILNVASIGSFVPGPYNAIYCATKSFVLSFSEALAEELSGTGIKVTALCPGGTKTAFEQFDSRNNSFFFPAMEASKVAQIGYKAFMKGKRVVIPGLTNKLQVSISQLIPRSLVVKLTKRMVNI